MSKKNEKKERGYSEHQRLSQVKLAVTNEELITLHTYHI